MVIADNTLSVKEAWRIATEKEGIMGFYRGWETTFLVSVNPAIQNTVFDQIKAIILLKSKNTGLGYWQSFWLGAFAKAVATIMTYPVTRAKLMIQCNRNDKEPKPASALLSEIIKDDGVAGLFKGLQPSLYKGVIQSAFMLMVKEQIQTSTRAAVHVFFAKE